MNLFQIFERLAGDPISTLKSCLIAMHLFGLLLGLGAATTLDIFIAKFMIMGRVKKEYCIFIDFCSNIVSIGLLILWVTGAGFLIYYYEFDPMKLSNQKVWAKIAIVAVLTLNGAFIHRTVLPLMRNRVGRNLFHGLTAGQRSLLLVSGAVSVTSWYVPLLLGTFPQLNFLPAVPILIVYFILLLLAILATHGFARLKVPSAPFVDRRHSEYETQFWRALTK